MVGLTVVLRNLHSHAQKLEPDTLNLLPYPESAGKLRIDGRSAPSVREAHGTYATGGAQINACLLELQKFLKMVHA